MLGIPSLGWWKVDTNISFYILTDLEFESSCCQNCFMLWLGCGWAGGVRSGTEGRGGGGERKGEEGGWGGEEEEEGGRRRRGGRGGGERDLFPCSTV